LFASWSISVRAGMARFSSEPITDTHDYNNETQGIIVRT
jgi:hypothetical protein